MAPLPEKRLDLRAASKKIQNETGFFDDTFLVLCGDAAVNSIFVHSSQSTNAGAPSRQLS